MRLDVIVAPLASNLWVSRIGLCFGLLVLTSMLIGCNRMDGKKVTESKLETPEGDVSLTTSEVEPSPQEISAVGKADLARFLEHASRAPEFVSSYVEADSDDIDLQSCDQAFEHWLNDPEKKFIDEEVIMVLGAYLGECCCEGLNMEWVVVTDEYGTDFAVSSMEAETLGFPFSTVAKRVESREGGFLMGVYRAIEDNISDIDTKKR